MKKRIGITLTIIVLGFLAHAQKDTLYIIKNGAVWGKFKLNEIDSIIFYNPSTPNEIGTYNKNSIHCNNDEPTEIVDVLNPITNKTWMDRNLGASRAATDSTDESAYGDLYQWGRFADGHQCRNSLVTSELSSTSKPDMEDFISTQNEQHDWLNPQNDELWEASNNPCPFGYRLPTMAELNAERLSWGCENNSFGAFNSPLKLTLTGFRHFLDGSFVNVDSVGRYWSSTVSTEITSRSNGLGFSAMDAAIGNSHRGHAYAVRCIKN